MENFFYTNRNHPDLDTLVTFVTNNYNLFIDSKIIDNNGVDVTNKYMDYETNTYISTTETINIIHDIELGVFINSGNKNPIYKKYICANNNVANLGALIITYKEHYCIVWVEISNIDNTQDIEIYSFNILSLNKYSPHPMHHLSSVDKLLYEIDVYNKGQKNDEK